MSKRRMERKKLLLELLEIFETTGDKHPYGISIRDIIERIQKKEVNAEFQDD